MDHELLVPAKAMAMTMEEGEEDLWVPIDKDDMKEINVGSMNWSVTVVDIWFKHCFQNWQSAKIFHPEIEPENLPHLQRALSRLCLLLKS